MKAKIILPVIVAGLVMGWRLQNTAPQVTITAPSSGTLFQWATMVSYKIAVIDKEDGNSAYDEIQPKHVIMSIRYVPDSTQLKKSVFEETRASQDILFSMGATTCFNCHQMKAKLIGPSFESIAKKYSNVEVSAPMLVQKVINGGSGVWGDVPMPSHPDLGADKVQKMVKWILKNGADPNQDHIPGIEGVFRTRERPAGDSRKGVYVLTASYADNGDHDAAESRKIGQHTVLLRAED